MDRTTEPVIAVLGYPIAGNAAQFALERALAVMQLDWRVLSFDVSPEHLHVALEGLDVLGVEGVLIDENLSAAAIRWARQSTAPNDPSSDPEPLAESGSDSDDDTNIDATLQDQPFDLLYRDQGSMGIGVPIQWSKSHTAAAWLLDTTRAHFESRGEPIRLWSRVGTGAQALLDALMPLTAESEQVPLESDAVDAIDLVVIAPSATLLPNQSPTSLLPPSEQPHFDDWPSSLSSPLVIDLCNLSVPDSLAGRGYRVITLDELQAGMLSRCLEILTHQSPPIDVLREAIEEYSAV